ncbi:MAG TPA: hypothetical protein VFW00_05615 [Rhodocyclaceae bacterium]|nr:hypothetical protein [Rhodocyclaceae bacterium]
MSKQRQRGISIITAIFLITVMAGLAVAGTAMLRTAQNSETADIQALRAKEAALAGLDWAKYEVATLAPATATTTNLTNMPATLASYTVTVTWTPNANGTYTDGGPAFRTYSLTAVACNRPTGAAVGCPNDAAATDGYIEAQTTAVWPQ